MSDFVKIFEFTYESIRDYILLLNSYWLTQIFLYLVVLSFVVNTILIMRGK